MKSKALLISSMAILMLGSYTNSAKAAFTWLSSPAVGNEISIKYRNFENSVTAIGEDLYGVGVVTEIRDEITSTLLWSPVTAGQGDITLIFNDFVVADIQAGTETKIYFTGGEIKLYYTDSNVASGIGNPAQGTNADPDGANDAFDTGSLWLSLVGVGGAFANNGATAFDESSATLGATLSALTGFEDGSGLGLLDVVGGSVGPIFDTNPGWNSNPTADVKLASTLFDRTGTVPVGSYPIRSNDPLRAVGVPAPGGLVALLGMWLTASLLGWYKRRG